MTTITTSLTTINKDFNTVKLSQLSAQFTNVGRLLNAFAIYVRPTGSAAFSLFHNDSASFIAPSGMLVGVAGPLGFSDTYDMTIMPDGDTALIIMDCGPFEAVRFQASVSTSTTVMTATIGGLQ